MTTPGKCSTNLIPDIPTKDNAFASHRKVAEAIADLIENEPTGGKAIGLQGTWGSGKTTVIKLLREIIQDPDYVVVEFDAWAHEGDPLRRTFLEVLVRELGRTCPSWIEADRWKKRLEEISGRREVKDIKTTPHLTTFAKTVYLLVALVPLGLVLLTAGLREPVQFMPDTHLAFAWKFVFGFIFTLAPAVAVALKWVFAHLKRRDAGSGEDNPWALLFNKATTEEGTESTKTSEPTSIDFETDFEKLMEQALADDKRRLILVLDNLDRVDPRDALSIWSTLQTFLQPANRFSKLWIIAVYDITGLRRVWSSRDTEQAKIASSFIDKSFHIRFEVPRPLLSNWHDYLLGMLNKAFPTHYLSDRGRRNEEFHAVYRVLWTHFQPQGRLPTPRELIVFVNQLGALHRQWQDQFPLFHLAYYVVLWQEHDDVTNIVIGLLSGTIPSRDYATMLGSDARDHLAALQFNVDVATAKQLLLRGPIDEALVSRDGAKLKNLENSQEGFWEVIDDIAAKDWLGAQSIVIANAAVCLADSGLLHSSDRQEAKYVFKQLLRAAAETNKWSPFDEETAKGIVSILTLIQEKESKKHYAVTILRSTTDNLPSGMGEPAQTDAVAQWVRAMLLISNYLASEDLEETIAEAVIEPIAARLSAPSTIESNQLGALLQALFELCQESKSTQESIEKLAADGFLLHHLNNALTGVVIASPVAWCLFLYLHAIPQPIKPPSVGNSDSGYERLIILLEGNEPGLVGALGEILLRYDQLGLLFEVGRSNPTRTQFVVACLRYLAETDRLQQLIDPTLLLEEWPLIKRMGRGTPPHTKLDELIKNLMTDSELTTAVVATRVAPERAGLYNVMALQGAIDNRDFRRWVEDGLKSVSKQQWHSALESEGDLVWLIIDLASINVRVALPEYEAAVIAKGRAIIEGWIADPGTILRDIAGGRLLHPLEPQAQEKVRAELLKAAENAEGDIAAAFFALFGDEIATDGFLPAPERYAYLFTSLLEKRNARGLEWAAGVLGRSNFQKTSKPILDFRGRIEHAILTDPGDSASGEVQQIGQVLGILKGAASLPETPSVGMAVGFVHDPDTIYLAEVIEVLPDDPMTVTLAVETPRGRELSPRVRHDQSGKVPGTYHFKA